MSYGSIDRITSVLISSDDYIRCLDDEQIGAGNEAIPTRAEALLNAVDAEINGLLEGLYTVPFTTVPALVEQIADRKAAYALFARRPGEVPQSIRDYNTWADGKLNMIIRRQIQLVKDEEPKRGSTPLVNKTESDQVFSASLLGTMPK